MVDEGGSGVTAWCLGSMLWSKIMIYVSQSIPCLD